jgi:ubiquinone/menaquinone biosynthesis C-methylase UbiE
MTGLKEDVRRFWSEASCGEVYAQGKSLVEQLEAQARARYELEPYIPEFARFPEGAGRDVLEIGVGMGADHLEWAKAKPRSLAGLDLTARAVDHTRSRLQAYGFRPRLMVGDAENLPFADESFDLVYSWGVLHHTPNTPAAIRSVLRVLRPGGTARLMIYHKYSLVGYMLWLRYAALGGRPWTPLSKIYAQHLESPGTKAYTTTEALQMLAGFSRARAWPELSFGDLLQGAVGQRHRGPLLAAAKKLWPRWMIRSLFRNHGLLLLMETVK